MAIEMIEEFDQGTRIKVIGVGGGGGNAVVVNVLATVGVEGHDAAQSIFWLTTCCAINSRN